MQIIRRPFGFFKSRIFLLTILFLSWIIGVFLGGAVFYLSKPSFVALMRSASCCTVSIVGLFILIVIPFLISAIAVFCSCPFLIFPLCFLSALSYGVCSFAVFASFGSAGWLAQLLIMFSENCAVLSLFVLWSQSICSSFHIKPSLFGICFSVAVIAGIIDFVFVSPFSVSVFIF